MSQELKKLVNDDEYLLMSKDCLENLKKEQNKDGQNITWSCDYRVEMPIIMKKEGAGAEGPTTLIEEFHKVIKIKGQNKALVVKRNKKWVSWNYIQFYEEGRAFARALISLGIEQKTSVNIIGFNAPEWMIGFWGSLFGGYLPVGVYTTNNEGTCLHMLKDSNCQVVIAENNLQLQKYLSIWDQYENLKYIVLYNDQINSNLVPSHRTNQVLLWKDLINKGQDQTNNNLLEERMSSVRPGTCCTLVYTSGTTGNPKGVILSHDNYSWTAKRLIERDDFGNDAITKMVSYLPLSHVASQIIDIILSMLKAAAVYFADEKALQGTLIQTLQEVRPHVFFAVPRVWEKIEEKMKSIGLQSGYIKKMIANFAKARGEEGSFKELKKEETSLGFNIAKTVVYNKIKYALGLDQCLIFSSGAAPLNKETKKYFAQLNIFIHNAYGMSETSGPQTLVNVMNHNAIDDNLYISAGQTLPGTNIIIENPDKDGNGEMCFKGRNRFVGYHNNLAETKKTIDSTGLLHSGDIGKLDSQGNLFITGRLKELIITAGGENVSPILIEDEIKNLLPIVANAMVVGDDKKYLVVLLTLKLQPKEDGTFTQKLSDEIKPYLKQMNSTATTITEAKKCVNIKKWIDDSIKIVNDKTISRASRVQKWYLLDTDFSVVGNELTPSMKLKRNVTAKKYDTVIQELYRDPAL